jgi:protein required for attachment to host cells
MSKTWVVVAESSRAKIFEIEKKNSPLIELEALAHPGSRVHEQELTSDLPGRSLNSASHGSHKMAAPSSAKEQESVEFARTISSHLDKAFTRGKFDKLIIMSPPAFLGQLRKELGSETSKRVVSEIDKNLVRHNTQDIQAHLPYSF